MEYQIGYRNSKKNLTRYGANVDYRKKIYKSNFVLLPHHVSKFFIRIVNPYKNIFAAL